MSSPAPRRVLVKEVNWLGDLVMSLPALSAIRRRFRDAHLSVLIRSDLADFFDGFRWIDEVIAYRPAHGIRAVAAQGRIIAGIRARRFDLAILFPNSFSAALWAAMARVPRRAGYVTDARGLLLTDKASPNATPEGHQADYWLTMVRKTVGAEGDATRVSLEVDDGNRERMGAMLAGRRRLPGARLIAIAPAAAYGPAKEWPAERFAAVVDLLAGRYGAESLLIGAPSERDRCERIAEASRHGAIATAGETAVGELMAMLSLCDGFIGNDSGAMHLAGALGLPTVAIFGSTDPRRTGPLGPRVSIIYRSLECSPCFQRTCRFGHYNCLGQIGAEEAVGALARLGALG